MTARSAIGMLISFSGWLGKVVLKRSRIGVVGQTTLWHCGGEGTEYGQTVIDNDFSVG